MKKKQLTAAILTALMAMGTAVCAAEKSESMNTYELAPVEVEGQRAPAEETAGGMLSKDARMGILGDVSVMDIPYSMQSMT